MAPRRRRSIWEEERGYHFHVFADETRPLLQGARLTAFELQSSGVDVTLICDNMSATVMKNSWVNAVFVGCDRVAANGDAANKIGTSVVAAVAKYYGVPVYICAPTSTIDLNTPTGRDQDRAAPGGESRKCGTRSAWHRRASRYSTRHLM